MFEILYRSISLCLLTQPSPLSSPLPSLHHSTSITSFTAIPSDPKPPSSGLSPAFPSPSAGSDCGHIQGYVRDAWNVFDALVVIGSVVDIILSQVERRHRSVTPALPLLLPCSCFSFSSHLPSLPSFLFPFC